jgi:hypothetical protein
MKRRVSHWLLGLACVLGGGCSTRATAPAAPLGTEQATAMCVRLHEQGAACLDPFAELLLELRATHDSRFAGMLKDPGMREDLRQAVRQETLADGTGPLEKRTRRCRDYATQGPPVPAEDPATLEACYALADCQQRVACMRPVLEQRFKARAAGR